MPEPRTPPRSPLGLIVLWLLWQQPVHVYGLQKMIEAQAKDRVVNVRARASLYQAIQRLRRLGLVEVAETVRSDRRPDRVLYAITEAGRETALRWLRETLRSSGGDFPEFMAGVSIMFGLEPDDVREQLEVRAEALATELTDTESTIAQAPADLPRLFLLEEEYRGAMLRAELSWLRGVIADIRAGRLSWSEPWLQEMARAFMAGPPAD